MQRLQAEDIEILKEKHDKLEKHIAVLEGELAKMRIKAAHNRGKRGF